jgi:alkanesulfonate monooxygenase SsuD/methylene tetrahydromethanopterin reductase-like flavin-dependent oxidoreductase (luciferase family)
MSAMPFRFAAQSTPQDATSWLASARHAEELGYSTLLMPDGMQLLSPLPALALAAGATTSLHVGTFVLASPLRPPGLAAWDAHTLSVLTSGRFELGIGTGRPEVVDQSIRQAGQPPTTGAQRLALAEQTIDTLRTLDADADLHTPVLMAVAGPKARAVAAAKADIITLAVDPLISREEAARLTDAIREEAGNRAGEIEFALPIFAVGDEPPPWLRHFLQVDFATLVAHDSLVILRGSPRQMADELERRREMLGVSYHSVNAAYIEPFAPVVDLLAGR